MIKLTGYISYDNVESAVSALISRRGSILAGNTSNHQGYQLPLIVDLIKIDSSAKHWTQQPFEKPAGEDVDLNDPTTDNYIYNSYVIDGLETDQIHYIDGNFQFRENFCEKLSTHFQNTTHSTWLLPLEIIYRNNSDEVVSRFVNNGFLRSNCRIFYTEKPEEETSIKSYALPVELDTAAVENILGWLHGSDLAFPTDNLDSQVKLLIASFYFQIPEIINFLTNLMETAIKEYGNDMLEDLQTFADNLPQPMMVTDDIKIESLEDLPRWQGASVETDRMVDDTKITINNTMSEEHSEPSLPKKSGLNIDDSLLSSAAAALKNIETAT